MNAPPRHAQVAFDNLGVTVADGVGTLRVYSSRAQTLTLVVYDPDESTRVAMRVPLVPDAEGVWIASSQLLNVGTRYAIEADGPSDARDHFVPNARLLDPYARGVARNGQGWASEVIDGTFDWEGVAKPNTPLDRTVIYEAHVRGLTMAHPDIPTEMRGTYAGLGHPVMTSYLSDLGITAVELLPVHAFTSEQRLANHGRVNYWGYNTLNFFSPHSSYATAATQAAGASAVAHEFKTMVKNLHRAGIEVILDVVFNHTAEEGRHGPTTSFRGLDNATYYRQNSDGTYIDVTGCGNSLNTANPIVQRLVLDSVRYWATEMGVDGFRFDLAVTLGRDEDHVYTPEHPLLTALVSDSALTGIKMIAEPWDTGIGGWQTGNFPAGWSEWNDRYRDRMRGFWLPDVAHGRLHDIAPEGVGGLATRLAGSSNTFSSERGPLAGVNFITAHDGFTLADLTSYDTKHNTANGEDNRDGADDNRSWNHGHEGPTDDPEIIGARRATMRALMATLLLSAGVPMITAGDESGRTQNGNNNAYCHDSPLTWMNWELAQWQRDQFVATQRLIALRRELAALRPRDFGRFGESVPTAHHMEWFNAAGQTMSQEQWEDARSRTLQYLVSSGTRTRPDSAVLVVIHGMEEATHVVLPGESGIHNFEPLWSSVAADNDRLTGALRPGDTIEVSATSVSVFRAT